ncbi:hypothetical protein RB601_008695 [Gaeumannomyces tritici]
MVCDNVVNFQVVLADGRVVEANKHENADHVEENPDSSFAGVWTYTPQAKDVTIYCLLTNLHGSKDQKAFEKFGAFGPSDETGEAKISAFVRQISLPPGQHEIWFTLTFKNDLRMVNKLLAGHEAMVEKLKGIMPDGNFTTQCVLQPLPALFARHSVERGGNMLGLDQMTGNAVLWLGTVSAPTRELGDATHGLLRAYATETEAHARELGLDVPLRRPVPAGAGDVRRRQCREDEGRGNQVRPNRSFPDPYARRLQDIQGLVWGFPQPRGMLRLAMRTPLRTPVR